MKAADHERAIKELRRKYKEELADIEAYWKGEVADRQAIIDQYAEALRGQDARIAALEAQIAKLKGD